ncbi:uncharacterized protein LOC130670103 isoform X5 [Microplitis mediator]|nr:uncharacterized protein LOC130666477 isoform X5 [Microplitis mediator]XP_057329291.1 uncharacterized protein LOC130670103 isoform X5 [Microplitis mediator]
MGPRKRILKFIESVNLKKNIDGSYIIEDDGLLTKTTEINFEKSTTFIQGHPLNMPSCSKQTPTLSFINVKSSSDSSNLSSVVVQKSPHTFSRFGTIKNTLLNHPQGKSILESIQDSWSEENRKSLIRIVVAELIKAQDSHYPPKEAKFALAKAITSEFPRLKDTKLNVGYEHYYNETSTNNRGFIENRLITIRKTLSPSKKKYKTSQQNKNTHVSTSSSDNQLPEELIREMISSMKLKMPTEINKKQIISYLKDTRNFRRDWIRSTNPSITEIFEMYPRLIDYNGEMINLEFEALFPKQADNFLSKFPTIYTPKILAYTKKYRPVLYKASSYIGDNDLRALLVLVELLPVCNSVKTPKGKGKGKGKGRKRQVNEDNEKEEPLKLDFPNQYLLRLEPEGTNLDQLVSSVTAQSKMSVQPYLVAVSGQSRDCTFINGDGWFISVKDKGNRVISFDVLYKIFYVLNVEYPHSLRNFYNFMDFYVYGMDVHPYSVVSSVHVNIINININDGSEDDDDNSCVSVN